MKTFQLLSHGESRSPPQKQNSAVLAQGSSGRPHTICSADLARLGAVNQEFRTNFHYHQHNVLFGFKWGRVIIYNVICLRLCDPTPLTPKASR